ncbi:MAG TPA: hypothetical protein VKG25_15430 [Bryobacteraceae bacterium]|nr:hypothetical protein [Bryobacteraceae bacterium]
MLWRQNGGSPLLPHLVIPKASVAPAGAALSKEVVRAQANNTGPSV